MLTNDDNNLSNQISNVPDGGWGWIIVFSSFMIHFIMDGITYSMGDIYLESMLINLKHSRAYVSVTFSLLESITLASAPISTVLTNIYGSRQITIVGSIIASFGFFLSRWWSNVYYYYITIGIIGGIGCGLIYLPAIVSVGYYFEEKRSFAMGIAVCGSGLGTVIFPFVVPWIIKNIFLNIYQYALLLESFLIFLCILFGLLMIPLPIEPSEQRRLKLKLNKQMKNDEKENIENRIMQNKDFIKENESVPFLPSLTSTNLLNEDKHYPEDRRHTTISFQTTPTLTLNRNYFNKKEYVKESLSQMPTSYRHSIVTIKNLPLYQGSLNKISLSNKYLNEHFMNNDKKSIELKNENENENEKLTKSIIDSIFEEINFNLLKNLPFSLFVLSNFLSSLGFFVPYNFAHDLAKDSNVIESSRKYVIMTIGLTHCFGHIIIGYLADRKSVNRLILYNSTLIIAGLSTIFAPYCGSNILPHMIYGSLFGFFSGGYVGLTSIITVDLVGIEKLSNGMGIILLFQGIATVIGTPTAGAMRDAFENHHRPFFWPYFMFGCFIVLSGAILFLIPSLNKTNNDKKNLSSNKNIIISH